VLDEVQGDEVLAPNLGVSGGVCRPGVLNAGMARIEVLIEVYVDILACCLHRKALAFLLWLLE